ncbi:ABC transporter permease [Planctomycetota bacterium]
MRMLNRKLRRDLRLTWKMLLAITSIIAVGIGCFIGMMSNYLNLRVAQTQYYSTCRFADFWIDLKKAPVAEVHRLTRIGGVSEIRDRLQFKVVVDLKGAEEPISAMVLSLPEEPEPVLNGIVMRQGSYFTHDRRNEVIVSEKFARARGLEPGDRLHVVMNERREELIMVGTAISAEFVYLTSPGSMVDDPKNYGLFYMKRGYAEDTFGFSGACNNITGTFTPDIRAQQREKEVLQALADRLDPYGVFVTIPRADQFSHMTLSAEMQQNRSMAFIFPSFFLVVAGLVLNVLMIRLAEQQRTIIGTLKALGYGNRELRQHFMRFGIVTGLMGGVMGCALGYWFGGAMAKMYLAFFSFPQLVNHFYPGLMLTGLLMATVACALGTLRGVGRVIQLEPAEAMRAARPAKGGRILLERWPGLWQKLDIQWQMVLRGLFRRKGRTAVAVFSAALGAAIVVLAFGFVDSMDVMIRLQFDKVLRSDYHLTFSSELDDRVLHEIRRLPGVTAAEPVLMLACTFRAEYRQKKGGVLGLPPLNQLTQPCDQEGHSIPIPATGLLMAQRLMDQLGLRPGDRIRLLPVRGRRDPIVTHVMQGFNSLLGLDVYADYQWLNRLMGESASVSEVRVLAQQNSEQRRTFMAALKQMPNLETVTDIRSQKQALTKQFDGAMRASATIMILFAAVIFFGSILNGTLIAIAERTREIATFSALGYFDRETGRLFFRENLLTNMLGALLGLPLGAAMLHGIMIGFQTDAYSIPAALRPISFLYTLILAFVFVFIAQLSVYRNMQQINRVEALSLKE